MNVNAVLNNLEEKHPGEKEYLQAVREVLDSVENIYNENPQFESAKIVERVVEPDRILTFKVSWVCSLEYSYSVVTGCCKTTK